MKPDRKEYQECQPLFRYRNLNQQQRQEVINALNFANRVARTLLRF
jgi:hypothetical protein